MWNYIYGLQRRRSNSTHAITASEVGTLGHFGLQAYYEGRGVEVARRAIAIKSHAMRVHDGDKLKVSDAPEALERYIQWVQESDADAGYTVVDVERRLYLPLGEFHGDTVTLTVEPDLVVRDKYGLLHILDHKFVERYTPLAGFVGSNRQGLTYSMTAESEYGTPVTSFTLNQINRKPPKTKTFVPVNRITQWNTPCAVKMHRIYLRRIIADMVQLHQEVESGDETGAYPNPRYECAHMCSFRPICCDAILKTPAEIADVVNTQFEKKDTTL